MHSKISEKLSPLTCIIWSNQRMMVCKNFETQGRTLGLSERIIVDAVDD